MVLHKSALHNQERVQIVIVLLTVRKPFGITPNSGIRNWTGLVSQSRRSGLICSLGAWLRYVDMYSRVVGHTKLLQCSTNVLNNLPTKYEFHISLLGELNREIEPAYTYR